MTPDVKAALEGACARYLEARPWERLEDTHWFGIEDADTGFQAWASVAGSVGEEHGLGLYLGREGRRVLEQMLAGVLEAERADELADVIALTVAEESEAGMFRAATRLEGRVEVRGKRVVPVVFRKPPAEGARALRDREAQFLARALEVVSREKIEPAEVEVGKARLVLKLKGEVVTREREAAPRGAALTPELERRLQEAGRTKRLIVNLDGDRLSIEDGKGKPLVSETVTGEAATRVLELLAGKGAMAACLPRELLVNAVIAAALGPVLGDLGVKVKPR